MKVLYVSWPRRCRWWLAAVAFAFSCMLSPGASADEPAPHRSGAFVPLLSVEDAWKRLPQAESGAGGPLPAWARALAGAMPQTTAATLELDRTYRTSDALDPKLAAAIRLAVARALRCDYARAYAESDLRRAGMDSADIARLETDPTVLPAPERAALDFAAKLSTSGYATTDAEVDVLVASFGEAKVVAIVLQVAYANFLNRMALALGLEVEPGGPVAPLEVRFSKPAGTEITPVTRPELPASPKDEVEALDPDWAALDFDQLQRNLEAQRDRKPRVSIPTWEEFRAALPEGLYPRTRPLRIRWSLLVSGRQPRLGPAWIKCLRVFEQEVRQDRAFEESLFWVTTKAVKCSYCMGHCEMSWEVAGLDRGEIAERSRLLAGDDWSSFPAAEQHAYDFARKLAASPWANTDEEIRTLKRALGPDRATLVVLNACRYHYMTRISNCFQLTLERTNVFYDYYNTKPTPRPGQAHGSGR